MGFTNSSDEYGTMAEINVTPLVDVMLVLLIIFMVAAPILQQGVELELPKETIAPVESEGEQLVVSIDKDAKVFIGSDNQVELENIGERLNKILATRKDKRVYIRSDKRVDYGQVMAVMARVRRAGITKVGLITEPN